MMGVLLTILNILGCAQQKDSTMNVTELKEKIKNNPSLVVLDVRTPEELQGPLGKIDGVVNIPVQQLEARIGEVEKYKGKEIAVICRTGHRSGIAQEILSKHGIKAINVKGGMTEYRNKGY